MKINVAGLDIYLSYSFIGEAEWKNKGRYNKHYKFNITCRYDGQKFSFVFNDSFMNWHECKQTLDESDLRDALLARMTDAACWKDDEFYGLNKKQIMACKHAYDVTSQVFGSDWDKVYNNLLEH